jgi:hypothetical protein
MPQSHDAGHASDAMLARYVRDGDCRLSNRTSIPWKITGTGTVTWYSFGDNLNVPGRRCFGNSLISLWTGFWGPSPSLSAKSR